MIEEARRSSVTNPVTKKTIDLHDLYRCTFCAQPITMAEAPMVCWLDDGSIAWIFCEEHQAIPLRLMREALP